MNRDNEENRGYGAENNGNAETENQRKAGGAGEEKFRNAGASAEEQTAGKGGEEKSGNEEYVFDFGGARRTNGYGGGYNVSGPGGYGGGNAGNVGNAGNAGGGTVSGDGKVPPELYERRRALSAAQPASAKKKKSPGKIIACVAGGLLIAAGGFFAGYFTYSGTLDEQIRTLLWVKGLIQENYYEEIGDDEFYDAVFDGVNGLLDPYSQYFSSEEYEAWMADSEGITLGAGITFSSEEINQNDRMLVEWVSGNSPAERAGIRTGMYVVGYGPNANEVAERGDYESVMTFLLEQPEGQPFVLAVSDTPDGEYEAVTLTREVFVANNVFYRSADSAYIFTGEKAMTLTGSDNVLSGLDEDTAYIRLVLFTGGASEQFAKAMDVFRQEGKKNLILDLRADGGGYLDIMCDIASYFCKDARSGSPAVATAEYRSGRKDTFYASGNLYDEYFSADSRIYVMADNGTASASECLIGAMVDYGAVDYSDIFLCTRSGEAKTYGKGVMQMTYPHLTGGDAVKLTTARICWPLSGNCIHGRGVLPEDGAQVVTENYNRETELLEVVNAVCGR